MDQKSNQFNMNSALKDLLGTVLGVAGKSKDDVIEIVGREIGQALAAMLKEPLSQVVNHRKLKISVELVPKHESAPKKHKKPAASRK